MKRSQILQDLIAIQKKILSLKKEIYALERDKRNSATELNAYETAFTVLLNGEVWDVIQDDEGAVTVRKSYAKIVMGDALFCNT